MPWATPNRIPNYEHYQMVFELLVPYLGHVHIKSGRWVSEPAEPPFDAVWKHQSAPMRDGCVDFIFLVRSLKAVGYDGWLSFEDFSSEKTQAEKVADNIAFMKEIEALA
jgi:sugar phosphate isomerase/epimerase